MRISPINLIILVAVALGVGGMLKATLNRDKNIGSSATAPSEPISFADHVRPILNKNCVACHGGVKKAGGISFIYRDLAIATAESGKPTIVPGDPDASELIARVLSNDPDVQMPPAVHGEKLDAEEIEILRKWIAQGAQWEVHWAFEAPVAPTIPTNHTEWGHNTIDPFVLAKMQEHGLSPSHEASPGTLLRRLKFDVLGLPPTLEELDNFEQAYRENPTLAWNNAIDKFLADPGYGERWASVWQDLARYADSEGLGYDRRRTAFPYRDWLIRAYNDDMPFDQFTIKQLAGDLLPDRQYDDLIATNFHRLTQANYEGGTDDEEFRVAAVLDRVDTTWQVWQGQTFACTLCHDHPYDTFDHKEYYAFAAFFDNTKDTDLTSHEPTIRVPTNHQDYDEALQRLDHIKQSDLAFLNNAWKQRDASKWIPSQLVGVKTNKGNAEIFRDQDRDEIRPIGTVAVATHFNISITPQADIHALGLEILPASGEAAAHSPDHGAVLSYAELRIPASSERPAQVVPFSVLVSDSQDYFLQPQDSLKKSSKSGWGAYSKINLARHAVLVPEKPISLADGEQLTLHLQFNLDANIGTPLVARRIRLTETSTPWDTWLNSPQTTKLLGETRDALAAYQKINGVELPVMETRDPKIARETRVFERGNWLTKGERIERPATPASFPNLNPANPSSPNRLDMARWLVSKENPLTARVVVNRYWHQLFGRGLVETLEDFGSSGIPPTHQELLDHLALEFQSEMAWSRKALLKEILLSATYRQSAENVDANREKDPRNVWMSYGSRLRLPGEAIRDAGLAVSGLLTQQLYGAPTYPPLPPGVWQPFDRGDKWNTPPVGDPQRYRRAIYTYWKRSMPYPTFLSFDAPTRELCSNRRLTSNTPIAALTTLNDLAFAEFSAAFAKRLQNEFPGTLDEKISVGYRLATSTHPNKDALSSLRSAHQDIEQTYINDPTLLDGFANSPEEAAYIVLASMLLNLDAALTK